MSKVTAGKGWIFVEDVTISNELIKKMSERSSHIYRDEKGAIVNTIKCILEENK